MTVLASCANAGEHRDARTRAVRASLFTTATPLQRGTRIVTDSTGLEVADRSADCTDVLRRAEGGLPSAPGSVRWARVEFHAHHRSRCRAIAIPRSRTPTRPLRSAAGHLTRRRPLAPPIRCSRL